MPWKKILCPIDFSDGARASIEVAARMAKEANAPLVLANVFLPPMYYIVEPIAMPASFIAEIVGAAEASLATWKEEALRLGAPSVSTELLRGDAAHEITELAKRDGVDLIVIGTHGRTGLKHVLLGSVAERVVRHASCPVLVVRRSS